MRVRRFSSLGGDGGEEEGEEEATVVFVFVLLVVVVLRCWGAEAVIVGGLDAPSPKLCIASSFSFFSFFFGNVFCTAVKAMWYVQLVGVVVWSWSG